MFSEFWYSMDDVLGMGGQYMYYKYRAASKVHKVLVHGTRGVDTKRPIAKCSMDLVQNVTLYFFSRKFGTFLLNFLKWAAVSLYSSTVDVGDYFNTMKQLSISTFT